MSSKPYDVAIVGAGIVGLASALALSRRAGLSMVMLEAEDRPGAHQTGHNSGVIHSGLYYRPGSLKATHCAAGREEMYRFCNENDVPYDRCGKIVVAADDTESARLDALKERGEANGLTGLRRLRAEEIREYEPHAAGRAGLWVPQTGIVDFTLVAAAMARLLERAGVEIRTGAALRSVRPDGATLVLRAGRKEVRARNLINCGGLQSDRIARLCGLRPGLRIIPFRGEYYGLSPERTHLVRNLIYPVPDPRFPFLGVHFTRRIDGTVEAGPNAVLALKREGYRRFSVSVRDLAECLSYGGFWRMGSRYWRTGLGELYRSLSRAALVEALRSLVPGLEESDLIPGGAGVRAQAVARDGSMIDDFHILEAPGMMHVLNAPSPAATASLAIGRTLAARARTHFSL